MTFLRMPSGRAAGLLLAGAFVTVPALSHAEPWPAGRCPFNHSGLVDCHIGVVNGDFQEALAPAWQVDGTPRPTTARVNGSRVLVLPTQGSVARQVIPLQTDLLAQADPNRRFEVGLSVRSTGPRDATLRLRVKVGPTVAKARRLFETEIVAGWDWRPLVARQVSPVIAGDAVVVLELERIDDNDASLLYVDGVSAVHRAERLIFDFGD